MCHQIECLQIWGGGFAKEATGASDYIFHEEDTWGVGSDASTVLINDKNEVGTQHSWVCVITHLQ